jgi:hypothetical protein
MKLTTSGLATATLAPLCRVIGASPSKRFQMTIPTDHEHQTRHRSWHDLSYVTEWSRALASLRLHDGNRIYPEGALVQIEL